MDEPVLQQLQKVPCGEYGLSGSHFYIQQMTVQSIEYRVLFFPLISDTSACKDRFEVELGFMSEKLFEVKFALGADFENENGYQFASPMDLGLPTLDMAGMNNLGRGLVKCIMEFGQQVDSDGFVAIALEDKPKLSKYYSRVLRTHEKHFAASGFEAKNCLGGQGYALIRTSYSVESARSASA
ncbi:hypothetical protein [Metapseudomonas otitidis]|uniref:hypothetical protein n=1 Tax=Metapseudomonas otitidis TaxID=319939 RepID=UPI00366E8335